MKRANTIGFVLVLILAFVAGGAAAPQTTTSHVRAHHVKQTVRQAAFSRHVMVRTKVQTVKVHQAVRMHQARTASHRVVSSHPVTRRALVTQARTRERNSWQPVSQRVATFAGRTRVVGQVVSLSNTHAIVRLPNGALRTFIALREESSEHERIVFDNGRGSRSFLVTHVSRPFAHRVVVVANEEVVERSPELTVLRAVDSDDQEIMLLEPQQTLVPFAVTTIEPLPSGRVALVAEDQIPQTFAVPTVSFIGQVIGVTNDLVTFLLPDGTTRTLVDLGSLPAVGSQVAVVENGQQVLSLSPAVTNFLGQVLSVDNNLVTFALPNGTLRTLTDVQAAPPPGTRVVVFENGAQVDRVLVL